MPDDDLCVAAEALTGCVVIERDYPEDLWHGRTSVRDCADVLERHMSALAVLSAEPVHSPDEPVVESARFEWDRKRRKRGPKP